MLYKQTSSGFWWIKIMWDGRVIRRSTKQKNKKEAQKVEAAFRTGLANGKFGIEKREPAPILQDFAPKFMAAMETQCADKPATVHFYRDKLKCLTASDLSKFGLDAIDEAAIDRYKQKRTKHISRRGKPLAIASVNRELATLRRLLRLAHEWKLIDRVPRIRLLRGEKNREFVLSHEQEPTYLAALSGPLHDVAVVLLDTGLRIKECLSLEWANVHLEPANGATHGYLTIRAGKSKNSKSRNVPLTHRVVAVLKTWGPAEGLVFQRPNGQPLYQTWLNEQHAEVRDRLHLSVEFVPHSLRHTYGTRLGESGADAFTIMKLMGHSTVVVSQRYVHPSPEFVEKAVNRLEALNDEERRRVGIKLGIPADVSTTAIQ